MEQARSERLLIVDGHAYAYRSFHAIRHLEGPSGQPTNAIFGFIKTMDRMRTALSPSHVVVVWDGGLAAERMAEHPEYKAQRPAIPDALGAQIDEIQHYLVAAGVASLCEDGVEADDWIGSIAQAAAPSVSVVIASSDKDFMQLVSAQIGLLNPNDKPDKADKTAQNVRIWTDAEVVAKTGVRPGQVVDWLSLVGDAVDNIPGVPGVGGKTAAELLQRFGSIEGILAGLDQVKSERVREAVRVSADRLMKNRRLIGLRPVAQPFDLDALRMGSPKVDVLRALYDRWGFRGLRAALEEKPDAVQQALL